MKTFQIFSFVALFLAIAIVSVAQKVTTETIPVSGNCGMCKTNIEKAAKKAGVSSANWDVEAKTLTVKYTSTATTAAKIQQAVAAAGYDTRDVKAADAAYDKLHGCCKYDRTAMKDATHVCTDKCEMKEGKCMSMQVCKEKGCCKDEAACKAKGCCSAD
jgi:periplasmic mercuric ion binding protein